MCGFLYREREVQEDDSREERGQVEGIYIHMGTKTVVPVDGTLTMARRPFEKGPKRDVTRMCIPGVGASTSSSVRRGPNAVSVTFWPSGFPLWEIPRYSPIGVIGVLDRTEMPVARGTGQCYGVKCCS